MKNVLLILVLSIAILSSCKTTKKIPVPNSNTDTIVAPVVAATISKEDTLSFTRYLYQQILASKINYTTFSSKVDVDYRDGEGKKYNVNANIRMYRDSAIWVSVTAILGIEGLRAFITKDSVKLLNKQDKVYTARSVSYLQEMTELPLDLYSLQELIIGNPVFLDSNIVSYSRAGETISLLSLGKFFQNLLSIESRTYFLQSSQLEDIDKTKARTCYLTYSDYENKKGKNFPARRSISVSDKKKLDILMEFKQYEFNETLSFPFNIPKSYTSN